MEKQEVIELQKIETLSAYVFVDLKRNAEGVVAVPTDAGMVPLIFPSGSPMEQDAKEIVQELCNSLGQAVKLVKFSTRTELETFEPEKIVQLH